MAIPDFQSIMLPLLTCVKDGEPHSPSEIHEAIVSFFELADEEISQTGNILLKNISLTSSHLTKADLIESLPHGDLRITSLGRLVLNQRLNSIDTQYLRRFPGYIED